MENSFLSKRPAVRVVLLFISGILAGVWFSVDARILLPLALFAALGAGLSRWYAESPRAAHMMLHLLLMLLGMLTTSLRRQEIDREVLGPAYFEEQATLDGRLDSEPAKKGARFEMAVRTSAVRRGKVVAACDRRVLVYVLKSAHWGNPDSLALGDQVRLQGYIEALPGARNPGEFDYGRYLALNGIQGFVTVRETSAVTLVKRRTDLTISDRITFAQEEIYSVLDRYHGPEVSSFLKGVVFGYRADLSAEIKQSFMDTGTIHILAVSGSNVVVVALIFGALVGFLRVSRKVSTCIMIAGLVWYMVITGMSPSVVRATIMGISILFASVLERKGDIYNVVASAALLMLIWDPLYLLDVGFLLSFAAVLSIVYYYPKLEVLIRKLRGPFFEYRLVDSGLKLFAVSLAAQIGTMPFTAYYFGRVSLIAVVANLFVVPVSGLNTLLGFATIGFSLVSDPFARCYAALNDILVSLLLKAVLFTSKVPLAYVETPSAGLMFAAGYYLGVIALFSLNSPKALVRVCIAALLLVDVTIFKEVCRFGPGSLTASIIDVGQGDAILLGLPNGKHILVDTGPRFTGNDSGERIIVPYLKRSGIESLEAILLSHGHDDHVGGCRYILEHMKVGQLIMADSAVPAKLFGEMTDAARQMHIPIGIVRAGQLLQFDPTTRIFVLYPVSSSRPRDLNNQSVVLKAVYGKTSILLPGDASKDVEDELLRKAGDLLHSDVLKSAHHGASTSSSEEFVRGVNPRLSVISVGRLNKFKHPSPSVLARYRSLGIEMKRTDLDGAQILRSDGMSFELVPWRRMSAF